MRLLNFSKPYGAQAFRPSLRDSRLGGWRNLLLIPLLFAFLFIPKFAFALEIPPRPEGYVTDRAGLLRPETKDRLEAILRAYEVKTTNQIVVAIFPSLEGESIEDFSIRLAEKWKAGQKGRDNGVIFLIFANDRKMRLEVGYGLEGVLPDAGAGQILSRVVVPHFSEGDFEGGILAGVDAVIKATQGEFQGDDSGGNQEAGTFLKVILIFCLSLAVIDLFRFGFYFSGHGSYASRYSFWEWWFLFSLLLLVIKTVFSALFNSTLHSRGGYYGNRTGFGGFSGRGSGGGGGFSGGGGRFGGGGASGRW